MLQVARAHRATHLTCQWRLRDIQIENRIQQRDIGLGRGITCQQGLHMLATGLRCDLRELQQLQQQVLPHQIARGLFDRIRCCRQQSHRRVLRAVEKGLQQTRLADACFAFHDDDAVAAAVQHRLQHAGHLVEFGVPTDQVRRSATLLPARRALQRLQRNKHALRVGLTLHANVASRAELNVVAGACLGIGIAQHATVGRLHQSRREIHAVPHDGVFAAQRAAHGARIHPTGGHTDAATQAEFRQG